MKIVAPAVALLVLAGCSSRPEPVPAPARPAALHEDPDYCGAVADWLQSPAFMRVQAGRGSGHEAEYLKAGRKWLRSTDEVLAALPDAAPEPVRRSLDTLARAGHGESERITRLGRADLARIFSYTRRYCFGG